MTVKHLRIDNRLIHGQVVVAWLQATGANTIVVANDKVAADDFQKTMLIAVTPPGIQERILSIDDALVYVKDSSHDQEQIFLLVKEPLDALRLYRGGLQMTTMNVGNMAFVVGTTRVSNTVFVGPKDVEAARELHAAGVALTCQMMPTSPRDDFMALLAKAKLL
jgi:mannose/fructose/N-acetylgalactosamine-specific phosphotransferase system component IIB